MEIHMTSLGAIGKALKTSKMADEEHAQTSRKRVADKQINKDNPEPDDDSTEQEDGTFKKATEEVMATRRIVKVRRQQPKPAPSNPFSAIRFTPSDSSVQSSVPVSEPPPSDVTVTNVKDSCLSEKTNEGSNGSGKDALSATDKNADSNEVDEIQKDEAAPEESDAEDKSSAPTEAPSPLVETDDKADDAGDGTGEDKVVVGEPKEDNCKTSGMEGKTEDVEAEEKKAATEAGDEDKFSKDDAEKKDEAESRAKDGSCEQKDAEKSSPTPLFSFKNLSSGQNAFTGLAGTGFSGSSFSFGSVSKESSNAPLFGLKSDGSSFPSFNIGGTSNGSSASALATAAEAPKKFAMPEGPVETGEENEKAVFTAESAIYEYLDGGWKERGKGELKLNIPVSGSGERSRLIMRARGNYRLILNASLYEDMSLKDMDKKGVTFACINSIGQSPSGLTTFAVKFKDTGIREDFKAAVGAHKAKKTPDAALKTPENSPKASDD
ncbi:nuclear pore complex protein NUP50A isoform X1 [Brachypodium distachyon]|nr:nuclear pore complex protein NUP50A isoform X1 [Brachypodium distachyon]|eukprot:XP_014753384.1 nuclear pore complex protein NUP50A isoform X1 [Brachypodium distachyon]